MTAHNTSNFVSVSVDSKIATVEFGHPASNSLPQKVVQELTHAIQTLAQQPEVLVLVLKSSGTSTFCAGAFFDELLVVSNETEATAFFSGFAHLINAMRKCPKLIIARVQGKVVGGGLGILAACDYVLASQQASIKLSELAIGIGPFVIEPALSRKIGKTALGELALAAQDWKSAAWAKEKGLYASTFETLDQLDKALLDFSSRWASYNPAALEALKKVLWEGTDSWETLLVERAAITGKLALSEFTKTALANFKNK
jgi:methylglutaconyl-CoA hydratase